MITTRHDAATGMSARISLQLASGNAIVGSPPGTGPMTAMPRPAKSNAALAAIVPTTAISATGRRGAPRRPSRMLAATSTDSTEVGTSSRGSPRRTSQACKTVWCDCVATPNMSPSIAMPT